MQVKITPSRLCGTLTPPPSKSLAHRAIICASLARGSSALFNISGSKDMEATIQCMQTLGAKIQRDGTTLKITGTTPENFPLNPVLNCNESGSTLRFLIPVAALSPNEVTFHGQGRLLSRPMGIYADLFVSQNLRFEQSGQAIVVQGPLQGGLFTIPGNVSSQFISGLLFACPLMSGNSVIAVIPPYDSKSYASLTLSMLRRFGIRITEPTEYGYEIQGNQSYQPCCCTIEADYSQAAFFAAAAAIDANIVLENLNPASLQGDARILEFIKSYGASVSWNKDSVHIQPGARKVMEYDIADCPDLGPILCVLAAYAPGKSVIRHACRLRIKESDRIAAMEEELKKWNVDISSDEDNIYITGKSNYCMDQPVVMNGHNDHRIVMAMTIFTLCAQSQGIIEDAQAIEKSYPTFFRDIQHLKGKAELV